VRSKILWLLLLIASLALTGCASFLGRQVPERVALSREVVWAQMGTPARIVDDRPIQVVLPDGKGGWLPGEARLQGMVALDEPTLDYYRSLDAAAKGHP